MTENQYDMQDPRSQYPQPKFDKQPQDAPGLAKDMDPKPDHGEESYKGFGRLKGRKALITGGDSGIGRAVAIAYAREGADVMINFVDSEESDASEVVELLRGEGHKIVPYPADITVKENCEQMIATAVESLGGLDILVINAGKQTAQTALNDITDEQFDRTMKTNIYAMFWLTKAALDVMPVGGAIINTTSIVAFQPPEMLVDYAMTKAAIVNFTKSVSGQAIEQGIRVNAVAPGPFWTPLQPSGGQPEDAIPEFGASESPFGRPGQPAEIAPVYVLLASQESSYVTGETYGVGGGNYIT